MQPARSSRPRFLAAESPSAARRGATATLAIGACMLGAGCFLGDVALSPPADALYYPTALVRSPGGSTLYVANSDFDLQYDGGTVLALNLINIRKKLTPLLAKLREIGALHSTTTVRDACNTLCDSSDTVACPTLDLKTNTNKALNPGPCQPIALGDAVGGVPPSGTIGAFASGAIFVQRSAAPAARLFLAVRGDPSITFFEVNDDTSAPGTFLPTLDCTGTGGNLAGERCNNLHRVGVEPFESTRAILLPTEPVGIAASEDGTAIVVAHQTESSVSLTIDDPGQNTPTLDGARPKPTLEFVLGALPAGPTEVAAVPIPKLFKDRVEKPRNAELPPSIDYQRGFLITYRGAPVVDLLRVHKDESGTSRPFLTRSNETAIAVNADGKDSRGVAVDASVRDECETACTAGDAACLLDCLKHPIDIFIANRTPPSLLVGRIETTTIPDESAAPTAARDRVFITDSIPLAYGASKVVVGKVIDPTGKLSRRVFVGAFDSKRVFSYDPQEHHVDAIFATGRGPQALAIDSDVQKDITGGTGDPAAKGHSFLVVGHFTDSYLGVVDLDMRYPQTFGTMFASVGTPTPPKASK
jgi:hypothetical protein